MAASFVGTVGRIGTVGQSGIGALCAEYIRCEVQN